MDIFFHFDQYLIELAQQYEWQIYIILFGVILFETGCLFTPFLPGNSLLFSTGMLVSSATLNYFTLIIVFVAAAILGAIINYMVGVYFGKFIQARGWIKPEHMERSKKFYETYGDQALIISRFMPYLHIVVPFIAAVAGMDKEKYIRYNIIAALLWVIGLVSIGFFLGYIPFVQEHFTLVLTIIIGISTLPAIFSFVTNK